MDRAYWQAIVDSDYQVPAGTTAQAVLPALLDLLGSLDPVLRDDFAYGIVVRWIDLEVLTGPDLQLVIEPLLTNLVVEIDSQGSDAVLLRSFSALILAAMVYSDNHKQPFLAHAQYQDLLNRVLAYFAAERDLRGYVAGIGWVHTVAHTADLLDELAINRWASGHDLARILDAIADKLANADLPLLFNEDDRLSFAVVSALKRDLVTEKMVAAWAARLGGLVDTFRGAAWFDDPVRHAAFVNHKLFLRSLVMRLAAADLPDNATRHLPALREALSHY